MTTQTQTQINQQNGIHLDVRASAGQAHAGHCWIPLPEGGCPTDLLPHVSRYLGTQDSYTHGHDRNYCMPVDAATWGAVRAEIAREDARAAEERAKDTVIWRTAAVKYLAGGDVDVDVYESRTYCGRRPSGGSVVSTATDVTAAEVAAVNAEHARREAIAEAKREEERQARAAALVSVLPRILSGEGDYHSWESTITVDGIAHRFAAAGPDVERQLIAEKKRRADVKEKTEAAAVAALVATLDERTRQRRQAGFCSGGQWLELLNRAASAQLKQEIETLGTKCGGPPYVGGTKTSALTDEQYAVLVPVVAYAREHGIEVETMSVFDSQTQTACADHEEYDDDCSNCTIECEGRRAIAKLSRVVGSVSGEGQIKATARIELGAY